MSRKTTPKEAMPMSLVLGTMGSLLATVVLFVTAIFVDKPVSTILIVAALVLFVLFFVMAYKLGKSIEDYEAGEAVREAKDAHPAEGKKSSTYSVLEPPTDSLLNQRYVEGSTWSMVSRDGQTIIKRYTLTDGEWVDTPITPDTIVRLDVGSMGVVDFATSEMHSRIERGDYGKKIL